MIFDFFEEKTPARLDAIKEAPLPTNLEWFVGIGTVAVACFGLITIIGGALL